MQKRLKNICKLYYGKNLPEKEFQNGDYPVCGANGIIGYHNQFTHTNEMLLVSCRGENSGVIHISPPYSFITNNSIICEFETDDVDTKFLYFFLKSQKREKLTSGSAQPQITTFDLGRFKLPEFPPKPEQTAIATLLSKVDEAIAATQNSIKAAEKLKKALMQNLLTGKLKPDGSWRSEDEFYEDEKFGKVPKGWEVARVKDYGFVQTGKTPPTAEPNVFSETENETRFPFITPGDLGVSKYISVSERYVTEKGIGYSFKVPANSICVVCIGSTIGKIGITKIESCTNQQINTLIANDNNSGEFFYYMMEYRKPHFKEIAGINATPQINKSGFEKYKLLRPTSKLEQEEIVLKIKSTDEEFVAKQTKIRTLQRLKKSLMQNLLTGKVRLPQEFIAQFEEAVEEVNKKTVTVQ
jgi:type I restriction enzyme S subunit